MLYQLIAIGPVALLLALLFAPAWYLMRHRPADDGDAVWWPYVLRLVLWATGGFFIGMTLGIALACTPADAGNLCGLVGVFGLGPLMAALGLAVAMQRWARRSGDQ